MSSLTKDSTPAPLTISADDGTPLSYYVLGSRGSKLIIVPGAMSSALSQFELGTALADTHSVYLFSRRGRGLSGPYPSSVSDKSKSSLLSPAESHTVYDAAFSSQVLHIDLQDLASLMRHTGATSLMGISSGSLIVLAALLPNPMFSMPPITKAIIFDPPLSFPASLGANPAAGSSSSTVTTNSNNTVSLSLLRRYEHEISNNDISSALVTAMLVSRMGPAWISYVPRWILRPLTRKVMAWEAREQAKKIAAAGGRDEGAVTMEALAPVLTYDFALCEAVMTLLLMPSAGDKGEAASMVQQRRLDVGAVVGKRDVMLLGGELSMGYIKRALDVLGRWMVTDGVERVEVPGAGHELFENKVRNGKVEKGLSVVEGFLRKEFK